MKSNLKEYFGFIQYLSALWVKKSKATYGRKDNRHHVIIGVLAMMVLALGWNNYQLRSQISEDNMVSETKLAKLQLSLDSVTGSFLELEKVGKRNLQILEEVSDQRDEAILELEKSTIREKNLLRENESLRASTVNALAKADAYEQQVKVLENIVGQTEAEKRKRRDELRARFFKLSKN